MNSTIQEFGVVVYRIRQSVTNWERRRKAALVTSPYTQSRRNALKIVERLSTASDDAKLYLY